MVDKGTYLRYYKRKEVQEAIVNHAQHKEIGVRFATWFGKRPDILQFSQEVFALAQQGATSFHCSEERWHNPLDLQTTLKRKELDALRSGWDLVLDIDCPVFAYSRLCAQLVITFLEHVGVQDISCKFSGNKGFHIGVPFEAFPKKIGEKDVALLFPDLARKVAAYVAARIEDKLIDAILASEKGDVRAISEKVGVPLAELVVDNHLVLEKFIEIDTVLISSRHLYRMPYSLHEKSGLVSVPIALSDVAFFEKRMARPQAIGTQATFLLDHSGKESALRLFREALDYEFVPKEEEEKIEKKASQVLLDTPVDEMCFPPCMKQFIAPLEDGKKRALFCLMNFLGKIGWNNEQAKAYLLKWNKKHPEPLREQYILGQLRHFKAGEKLPPNCANEAYYKGLGVCKPDGLCKKVKNPANYAILRHRAIEREQKKGKKE